jgi:hypothetical protein
MVYLREKCLDGYARVGDCTIRASEFIIIVPGIRHKLGVSIMNTDEHHAFPSNSSNVSVAISTIVCESTFGSKDTMSIFLVM